MLLHLLAAKEGIPAGWLVRRLDWRPAGPGLLLPWHGSGWEHACGRALSWKLHWDCEFRDGLRGLVRPLLYPQWLLPEMAGWGRRLHLVATELEAAGRIWRGQPAVAVGLPPLWDDGLWLELRRWGFAEVVVCRGLEGIWESLRAGCPGWVVLQPSF